MPYDVVQLASMGDAVDAQLAQHYRVYRLWDEAAPIEKLRRGEGEGARAVVTSVRRGLSREVMQALPELRAVCSWGVGYETLDVDAAVARSIVVANTPDVLDDCVADLAWALLLTAARRTAVGDRYVKGGQWRTIGAFPLSTRVWGKRMGVLGMGRIGRAIADRATGFKMEVRYNNRRERPDTPYSFEPSLVELANWADFLVIACPGGAATHHLVNAEVIRALGPTGIVVNIARGTVIDQVALLDALACGTLGGAGLDVLDQEPKVPAPFATMDQVALMPHVGSATIETRADMSQLVFDNVDAFFKTGRVLTPVSETA